MSDRIKELPVRPDQSEQKMSIRVKIAARIMAGVSHTFNNETEAAKWAVKAADALIKELNK